MQELAREATSPAKLPRLPATALAVWRNIDTSMIRLQAARFAIQMRLASDVEAEIYPGAPKYIDGIAYWVPDRVAGQRVVDQTVR